MRRHRWMEVIAAGVGVVVVSMKCAACNPAFVPGDAFFHATITKELLDHLAIDKGTLSLRYSYPEPMSLGGYVGFARMDIGNCPPSLGESLRRVYRQVRRTHPRVVQIVADGKGEERCFELNGLELFVYSKGRVWDHQQIGLKYNEHWYNFPVKVEVAKGTDRLPIKGYVYRTFLPIVDAVTEDWQNSSHFSGLSVKCPDVAGWGLAGPEILTPITGAAVDLEFVILAGNVEDYFNRKDNATFYVIQGERVREMQWQRPEDGGDARLKERQMGQGEYR
jgi:hypothetical protein